MASNPTEGFRRIFFIEVRGAMSSVDFEPIDRLGKDFLQNIYIDERD
jgi:hypothetical protein